MTKARTIEAAGGRGVVRPSGARRVTVDDAAWSTARQAADRAQVTVLELRTPAETERAESLLRDVWQGDEAPVPANLLRTVQHIGGYLFGAYDSSGHLLAASLGMLSRHDGDLALHSHITGVLAQGRRRGLGFALKQHQRWWALAQGLSAITWTCDPLVLRNVSFNLRALGADVSAYLPDHYGTMRDGVNAGDESDRLELVWTLDGPGTHRAASQRLPAVDGAGLPFAVVAAADGSPVVTPATGARLVQLPASIEVLRRTDPPAARAWRRAVREALVPALAEGAGIHGLTAGGALLLDLPR